MYNDVTQLIKTGRFFFWLQNMIERFVLMGLLYILRNVLTDLIVTHIQNYRSRRTLIKLMVIIFEVIQNQIRLQNDIIESPWQMLGNTIISVRTEIIRQNFIIQLLMELLVDIIMGSQTQPILVIVVVLLIYWLYF